MSKSGVADVKILAQFADNEPVHIGDVQLSIGISGEAATSRFDLLDPIGNIARCRNCPCKA